MSTLISINRSWHDATWLFEQLAFASEGDSIILMEDAILALHSPITLGSFLGKCHALGVTVYALNNDIVLRGVGNKYNEVKQVDYRGYVDLVVAHDKQVAW